ncbi:hypothetical protein [Aeromonas rivipollensis]|uniref:hypothetical protein n=1 Tax=Aeromonas rivipollensis TaxID=948519 RepID=UPI0013CF4B07|nr:hypothetical protein [Aeromonas rivipollensis]NEX84190.1 hypothetical protein [Aeromonas rivipollensis]
MLPVRPALLLITLLLGGCASPAHQQLGQALSGLEGELQRLEEELAAMNGLHYQKAIDAPLALRRYLSAPSPTAEGLVPAQSQLQDGPLLRYDYRLPTTMTRLPTDNPCLRYEFELRHLGRLGQLELAWQGKTGAGELLIQQRDCPFSAKGPGLQ